MPRKRHVSRNGKTVQEIEFCHVMPRKRHVSRNFHQRFVVDIQFPVMPRKRHVSRNSFVHRRVFHPCFVMPRKRHVSRNVGDAGMDITDETSCLARGM